MITAVLIGMIVVIIGVLAIGLALHNQDASAFDRDRIRAVHAAEAGINIAVADLESIPAGSDVACTVVPFTGSLTAQPVATFEVTLTYYKDEARTDPFVCGDGSTSTPLAVVIDSVGHAGRTSRRMQSAALLDTRLGTMFDKAIFSDASPIVSNHVDVTGDVYTSGNWTCAPIKIDGKQQPGGDVTIDGNVDVQGNATLATVCRITGDVHTGGTVSMLNNARVDQNVISVGDITVEQSITISNWARTTGSCVGCEDADVGQISEGETGITAPEYLAFPRLPWDFQDWDAAGYDVEFAANHGADECAAAHTVIDNWTTGNLVVRIASPCLLEFTNNDDRQLPGNLAIVTDGAIAFSNGVSWSSSSETEKRLLHLIVPWRGTDSSWCNLDTPIYETSTGDDLPAGSILKQNNTDFERISFFAYSPCYVELANNNVSSSGQIYGGTVKVLNNFELLYDQVYVPGLETIAVVGYRSNLLYLREVPVGA